MKISSGIKESGVVVGNNFDKYNSKNPVVRYLMDGFHNALTELVNLSAPTTLHEVGCGEGILTIDWCNQGLEARGSDFSEKVISIARDNAVDSGMSGNMFSVKDIYTLQAPQDCADLLVCCEVLEHIDDPKKALQVLQEIVTRHLILSVPREPIWRTLNMMRGKYLRDFGNTPGHIQHWSTSNFKKMVQTYFVIEQVRTPLPWTMLLCRPR